MQFGYIHLTLINWLILWIDGRCPLNWQYNTVQYNIAVQCVYSSVATAGGVTHKLHLPRYVWSSSTAKPYGLVGSIRQNTDPYVYSLDLLVGELMLQLLKTNKSDLASEPENLSGRNAEVNKRFKSFVPNIWDWIFFPKQNNVFLIQCECGCGLLGHVVICFRFYDVTFMIWSFN